MASIVNGKMSFSKRFKRTHHELTSILKDYDPQNTKKNKIMKISWKDEKTSESLVEERIFPLDKDERCNVYKLKVAEKIMTKKSHQSIDYMPWKLVPITVVKPEKLQFFQPGGKSTERARLEELQKKTPPVLFYFYIPDFPEEPPVEYLNGNSTKIISTVDSVNGFTDWSQHMPPRTDLNLSPTFNQSAAQESTKKVCYYFMKGICNFGEKCKNLHTK